METDRPIQSSREISASVMAAGMTAAAMHFGREERSRHPEAARLLGDPVAAGEPVTHAPALQEIHQRTSTNNTPRAKSVPKIVLLCRANQSGR